MCLVTMIPIDIPFAMKHVSVLVASTMNSNKHGGGKQTMTSA